MLSVNNFRAPLTFTLLIRFLNFNEILAVVIPSLSDLNFCWIVIPSYNSPSILPLSHNFMRLSSSWRWSLAFEDLLGFYRSNASITWNAFSDIDLNCVSCIHNFMRRVTSSIYLFPSCSTWQHKQVLLPVHNLFICIV